MSFEWATCPGIHLNPRGGSSNLNGLTGIMDKMAASGIKVILDIPGSPAPIWLHRAYPGVDIINEHGERLPPAERYMDDIGDPDYARDVEALAEALTKRYAHHRALIAVGYPRGRALNSHSPSVFWVTAQQLCHGGLR